MKALRAQQIFPVLISVSVAVSIQSMTHSSDAFGNRNCAMPHTIAPTRASKHDVAYVTLEKFRKDYFMIKAACLKSTTVDNALKFAINHPVHCNAPAITHR